MGQARGRTSERERERPAQGPRGNGAFVEGALRADRGAASAARRVCLGTAPVVWLRRQRRCSRTANETAAASTARSPAGAMPSTDGSKSLRETPSAAGAEPLLTRGCPAQGALRHCANPRTRRTSSPALSRVAGAARARARRADRCDLAYPCRSELRATACPPRAPHKRRASAVLRAPRVGVTGDRGTASRRRAARRLPCPGSRFHVLGVGRWLGGQQCIASKERRPR